MPIELTTAAFLSAVLAGKPDWAWSYLWSMGPPNPGKLDKQGKPSREKLTHWFQDVAAMEGKAASLSAHGCDVYLGCALAREPTSAHERLKAAICAGLWAFWLDIDHLSPGAHKKTDLPPDLAAATALALSMPLPPSLNVRSGNGVQPWWLFKEPWIFETEAERCRAECLLQGWNKLLIRKSAERAWQADSTGDLARVMRVPGTFNHKTDPPRLVTWEDCGMHRYDPGDFEPWIGDEVIEGVVLGGKVTVNAAAGIVLPPKFFALQSRNRKFKRSWARERDDLKDQSMSGYDFSIAGLAIGDGWSDQEITDLLVAFACLHGQPVKDERYFRFTIAKARRSSDSGTAVIPPERMEDLDKAIAQVYGVQHADEKQEKVNDLLVKLNAELGISIVRIARYPASGPVTRPAFRFYFPSAIVHFANGAELSEQGCFWAKLREQKVLGGKIKKNGWTRIADGFVAASEDEEVDNEAVHSAGYGVALVRDYLASFPPASDPSTAHPNGSFVRGDVICFYFTDLTRWANDARRRTISAQELGIYLRDAGCESRNVRHPRTKKQGRMWVLPKEVYDSWNLGVDEGAGNA